MIQHIVIGYLMGGACFAAFVGTLVSQRRGYGLGVHDIYPFIYFTLAWPAVLVSALLRMQERRR